MKVLHTDIKKQSKTIILSAQDKSKLTVLFFSDPPPQKKRAFFGGGLFFSDKIANFCPFPIKKILAGLWDCPDPIGHKSADFVCFRPNNRPQKFLKIAFFWLFRAKNTFFFVKNVFLPQNGEKWFLRAFFVPRHPYMVIFEVLHARCVFF